MPVADGAVQLSGGDQVFRKSTLIRDQPDRGEECRDDLQGESDGSQPMVTGDSKVRNDRWSIEGTYLHRHHVEPRVTVCVPKEESSPVPPRHAPRGQENNIPLGTCCRKAEEIDDWIMDDDRNLSEPWTGFTQPTSMKNLLTDTCGPGRQLAKIQATTRPDHSWPELGPECQEQLNVRKSSNGLSRNRSSTMRES